MSGQPTFSAECQEAFNLMNTQESPNDFFVCGFDGATHNMKLVEMGKGGMARVKEILKEQFSDQTAIAMFRVTAVDDRENTVSYRTKLIHVIYTGPNTPVMKRAKITPFNAAFKQPFTFNLSIQSSDDESDLNENAIEKTLRASGGAHQPTRFDFTNCSAPGEGESKVSRRAEPSRSPSHSPSVPAASPKSSPLARVAEPEVVHLTAEQLLQHHSDAFDAKNADEIATEYAPEAKLFLTDSTTKSTGIYTGPEEIGNWYRFFIASQGDSELTAAINVSGNIATIEWSNPGAGYQYGHDVLYVVNGKIVLQTIAIVTGSAQSTVSDEPDSVQEPEAATAEEADSAAVQEYVEEQAEPAAEQEQEGDQQIDEFTQTEGGEASAEVAGEGWEAVDGAEAEMPSEDAPVDDAGEAHETSEEQPPNDEYVQQEEEADWKASD